MESGIGNGSSWGDSSRRLSGANDLVVDGLNDRPWIYGYNKRGGCARTVVHRRSYSIGDRSGCYAGSVSECLGWDVSAAAGG